MAFGRAQKDTVIRTGPNVSFPIRDKVEEGDQLRLYHSDGGWRFVLTEEGKVGFLLENEVEKTKTEEGKPVPKGELDLPKLEGKINLTWEHVSNFRQPNPDELPSLPGLNVISPTWFHVADEEGNLLNRADLSYVRRAHDLGYQVWALVSNGFDPERTDAVLTDPDKRERVIRQLLIFAEQYDLDGINVDFENIFLHNRRDLVQFVRELTPLAHQAGLVISIDVTAISASEQWSQCYDRQALGETVDYMMLMAYDEHGYTGSDVGSTASLPWVEKSIQGLLDLVPREKLVLGIPFYTRLWKETVSENGQTEVEQRAVGMQEAERLLEENQVEPVWDEEAQQYYGEFTSQGHTYRIWLENEASLRLRLQLVEEYGLAGVASWRRGFEKPSVWPLIEEILFTQ